MIKANDNFLPLVSVIMSVYNSEQYIKDCVQSILNQTYKNFELIIIDDNSTDNTFNILSSFNDDRIVLYKNNENQGLTKNLNFAIKKSNGKYIMRIDGDDICCANRMEKQVLCMESEDVDVLGSNAYLIDVNNKIIGITNEVTSNKDICNKMLLLNPMIHPTVMFKSKILKKFMYNENFRSCQDFELWVRMNGSVIFKNLKMPLIFYRVNPDGVTRAAKKKIEDRVIIIKKIINYSLNKNSIIITSDELDNITRFVMIVPSFREDLDKINLVKNTLNSKFDKSIYKYLSFIISRCYHNSLFSPLIILLGFCEMLIYYLRCFLTRINFLNVFKLKKALR